jgi:hypothetical protein
LWRGGVIRSELLGFFSRQVGGLVFADGVVLGILLWRGRIRRILLRSFRPGRRKDGSVACLGVMERGLFVGSLKE